MYLRVLAASYIVGTGLDGSQLANTLAAMTCCLEAFQNPADWQAGRGELGDIEALRHAYNTTDRRIDPAVMSAQQTRVRAVQGRIGERILRS